MGLLIYNLTIKTYSLAIRIMARVNPKARLFVEGRKGWKDKVAKALAGNTFPVVWFHCASLGEFEQGRPVMEAFKVGFPKVKIFLTFFSPSGYEVRKNYAGADFVSYLPTDTASNAKDFLGLLNPKMVFFVKYEFWYHYLKEASERSIPCISFSAIFRPEQLFFKPYGGFYRKILALFSCIFVQNEQSERLLNGIGLHAVATIGDTRFDRVLEICRHPKEIPLAMAFKDGGRVMVIGSSWPEDMDVLASFINHVQGLKFIIAPHEIDEEYLIAIEELLEKEVVRYSKTTADKVKDAQVLIIDNIGMLSSLYQYGEYAYVGGAFGKGLHNILEAATFGLPVFFGNKQYKKFQEAMDLAEKGGAFPVSGTRELNEKFDLLKTEHKRLEAARVCYDYIHQNAGATEKIMDFVSATFQTYASEKKVDLLK
jgi:3-deoxy-D-manno-octulosonic-acid transferase